MLGVNSLPSEFQLGDQVDLKNLVITSVRFTEEGCLYDLRLNIGDKKEDELDEEDFYFLADIPESVLIHNK